MYDINHCPQRKPHAFRRKWWWNGKVFECRHCNLVLVRTDWVTCTVFSPIGEVVSSNDPKGDESIYTHMYENGQYVR